MRSKHYNVAVCAVYGECFCDSLKNLKYSQCPCEFTIALRGDSAHCLGNIGLKDSWYFAFFKKEACFSFHTHISMRFEVEDTEVHKS